MQFPPPPLVTRFLHFTHILRLSRNTTNDPLPPPSALLFFTKDVSVFLKQDKHNNQVKSK